MLALLHEGLKKLGCSVGDLTGLCVAMAGMDRPQQVNRMLASLTQACPNTGIQVINDALAALSAGTRGGSGVVLIAGTGSIAVAQARDGSIYRSGGYGYLIGDEGSGFDMGRRGLMAAIAGYEKRGPKTRLWDEAADFFAIRHPQEIISLVYEADHPVGMIAGFSRRVLTLQGSDQAAHRIVEEALVHYTRLIDSVFAQVTARAHQTALAQTHWIANLVVLAGGLLTGDSALAARLQSLMPERKFTVLKHTPAAGAALRAVQEFHSSASGVAEEDASALWESLVKRHEQGCPG